MESIGLEWNGLVKRNIPEFLASEGAEHWARNQVYSVMWGKRYEQLAEHIKVHKRLPAYKDCMSLYSWLALQRKKNKEGRLAPHQVKMLDNLGVEWRVGGQPSKKRTSSDSEDEEEEDEEEEEEEDEGEKGEAQQKRKKEEIC